MPSENNQSIHSKPSSHDWLWWLLLLPLFLVVLLVGLYVAFKKPDKFSYLFGIAAFSIAYALHFFSVSGTLCSVYIRTKSDEDDKFELLRTKEYRVVTSAMCTLAGGLGILLSGGLYAIDFTLILCLPVVPLIYIASALLLFGSVLRYVLTQRRWPREARQILNAAKKEQ